MYIDTKIDRKAKKRNCKGAIYNDSLKWRSELNRQTKGLTNFFLAKRLTLAKVHTLKGKIKSVGFTVITILYYKIN